MTIKVKKRTKRSRLRGAKTCFHGARKKHRGKGHKGGKGKAGSGKRADHNKKYYIKGERYFGKTGITSKKTGKEKKKKNKTINLECIEKNIDSLIAKGIAKKEKNAIYLNFKEFKILGKGDLNEINKNKEKLIIDAKSASKSAIEKIKRFGGEIMIKKETLKKRKTKEIKE